MSQDLLSVCIITYNHEKFIAEAIESVLMQKTNFDFRLVIADDYSRDGTREIIKDYKAKYPQKIQLILQEKNVGAAKNWMDLLLFPQSKYIAYFEGDDYWTDPLKLQKQIDFLENNIDYGLTYSCSRIQKNEKILDKTFGSNLLKTNLFEANCIPTLTVMFRTKYFHSFLTTFEEEIKEWKIGDYPFWLYIHCNTKIYFMDIISSVHRVVQGSASNRGNRLLIKSEAFKISNFFLKRYKLSESPKVFFTKRLWLILTCLKNEPSSILKILKII